MNFLLIGCNGKMGESVARIAKEYGDTIVCGVDVHSGENNFPIYTSVDNIKETFDAIIDFSTTENHLPFIKMAKIKRVPYGLFSTVTDDDTLKYLKIAAKFIPILHCRNTSVGANVLFDIVKLCAQSIDKFDCAITEFHHKTKLDNPSGTAKEIENILKTNKANFETHAFRVDGEVGRHSIDLFLADEHLTITHQAHSRDVFARGAIIAMHKLNKKKKGLYFKP